MFVTYFKSSDSFFGLSGVMFVVEDLVIVIPVGGG